MDRYEAEGLSEHPHDESDYEGIDAHGDDQEPDGPLSLHLDGLKSDATDSGATEQEKHELSFLRLENTLLKKKIKALERISRGEKRSVKLIVDESDMERINDLLKKAEDAKAEALDYVANTSREKLGQDVKVLQSILKKAKAERHAFKKKIRAAEEKLQLEKQKIEKEEIRFQVDREIFAKIVKDDRDAYKYEVNLLAQKVVEVQKEKHELFLWAKEQQERHLQELRKLTRALARTRKMADEQKAASEAVLCDVRAVQAVVVGPVSDLEALEQVTTE